MCLEQTATHCRPESSLLYNVIFQTSFWPNYLDYSTLIVDNIIYTTRLDQIVTHHPTPTAAEKDIRNTNLKKKHVFEVRKCVHLVSNLCLQKTKLISTLRPLLNNYSIVIKRHVFLSICLHILVLINN
jgi:hypothetical protein